MTDWSFGLLTAGLMLLVTTSAAAEESADKSPLSDRPSASFLMRETVEAEVRARLVDPGSVQFEWPFGFTANQFKPDIFRKRLPGLMTCGWFNSRNRMGGYSGRTAFFVVMDAPTSISLLEIVAVDFEDTFSVLCNVQGRKGTFPRAPSDMFPKSVTSTPSAQGLNIADELGKLAGLRRQGILTEAEFQAQKAKLLAK
jgi:hypothetical protein